MKYSNVVCIKNTATGVNMNGSIYILCVEIKGKVVKTVQVD